MPAKLFIIFLFIHFLSLGQQYDKKVEKYLVDNKISKALSRIESIYENDTNSLDYLYLKGLASRKKGNYTDAFNYFNRIIQIDSSYSYAYSEIGVLHAIVNKDYTKSLEFINKALEMKEGDPLILGHRGGVYYVNENYTASIADYQEVIKKEPKNDYAIYNLGICYTALKKYDLAINEYNKALKLRKRDSKILYDRGRAYYYQKKYSIALKDFKKTLRHRKTENKFERIPEKDILWYIVSCKQKK